MCLLLVRDYLHEPLEVEVGAEVDLHPPVFQQGHMAAAGALQLHRSPFQRALEPSLPAGHDLPQTALAERVSAQQDFRLPQKLQADRANELLTDFLHFGGWDPDLRADASDVELQQLVDAFVFQSLLCTTAIKLKLAPPLPSRCAR